jgi:hypothetical protein
MATTESHAERYPIQNATKIWNKMVNIVTEIKVGLTKVEAVTMPVAALRAVSLTLTKQG